MALDKFIEEMITAIKKCQLMFEAEYKSSGEPVWHSSEPEISAGQKPTIFISQDESIFNVLDNDTGVWLRDGNGKQREKGKGERKLMRNL